MPDKRLSPTYYNKMMFAKQYLKGSNVLLDVGCGEGGYFYMYKELGIKYTGIDPDASVLRRHEPVKIASAEDIPFRSSSFDTVVCMDVLEHAKDPDDAMSEIRRVLMPGGKLIISVANARYPASYDLLNAILRPFGRHMRIGYWAWGHRRLYLREDFRNLLQSNGFCIEHMEEYTHGFVTAFMSYLPYFSVHVAAPVIKKFGMKNSGIDVSGKPLEHGMFFRLLNTLNIVDKKYFGRTHGLTICALARKR